MCFARSWSSIYRAETLKQLFRSKQRPLRSTHSGLQLGKQTGLPPLQSCAKGNRNHERAQQQPRRWCLYLDRPPGVKCLGGWSQHHCFWHPQQLRLGDWSLPKHHGSIRSKNIRTTRVINTKPSPFRDSNQLRHSAGCQPPTKQSRISHVVYTCYKSNARTLWFCRSCPAE